MKTQYYGRAITCRLPPGTAENFDRLEALRNDVMYLMECITTDPHLTQPGWTETGIQRAADRLKAIWIKRAEAIEDARAKGWQFVYGKGGR